MQLSKEQKEQTIVLKVATPHGSDKNATSSAPAWMDIRRVATPHGSDKNATLLGYHSEDDNHEYGCNSPRVR